MPICEVGNSKQIEFGYGDIKVAGGLLQVEGEPIGAVSFCEQEVRPIGHYEQFEQTKELELINTPVRMVFTKIESIDVVIRALERTKRYMINGSVSE